MNEIQIKVEKLLKECGAEANDAGYFYTVKAVGYMAKMYEDGDFWPYGNNSYGLYRIIIQEGCIKCKPYSIDQAVRRFIQRLDHGNLEIIFRSHLYVRDDYMTSPHDFFYALMKCVTTKKE